MSVDYRQQYPPEQLEPFWPNEILKMVVAVLCTLAVIMFFAVLPVVLDAAGLTRPEHHEEPANPRGATPEGIKPEWYFLGTYQYLRLMPTTFLGISGKTWGVLSQGGLVTAIVLLPFWYRKRAGRRPTVYYRAAVTAVLAGFLVLTVWGGWPEEMHDGHERLAPLGRYFRQSPGMFLLPGLGLLVFYLLVRQETRTIRRVQGDAVPHDGMPGDGPGGSGNGKLGTSSHPGSPAGAAKAEGALVGQGRGGRHPAGAGPADGTRGASEEDRP